MTPLTGPAHFALLTGRYAQELGVRRNGVAMQDGVTAISLPKMLGRHGYERAAFISAWPLTSHLTHLDKWFNHHFDEDSPGSTNCSIRSRYAEDVTPGPWTG